MRDDAPKAPILVVEDSEDDVFLLQHAWNKSQVQVPLVFARDGEEAITWLRDRLAAGRKTLPKVVLTDLKLPKVTGFEVLEFLRVHCATEPLVPLVWSNSSEMADLRRAYGVGARCYLPKPRDDEGWRILLERILEFYAR